MHSNITPSSPSLVSLIRSSSRSSARSLVRVSLSSSEGRSIYNIRAFASLVRSWGPSRWGTKCHVYFIRRLHPRESNTRLGAFHPSFLLFAMPISLPRSFNSFDNASRSRRLLTHRLTKLNRNPAQISSRHTPFFSCPLEILLSNNLFYYSLPSNSSSKL